MKKREFLKSAIGLAGMSALAPTLSIETLASAPAFELPKLPYAYADLEPVIDARTMEIHYSKHHAAYLEKLNQELAKGGFEYKSIEDLLARYAAKNTTIRNHGGGHYNHALFWKSMTKPGTSKMSPDLIISLTMAFESVEAFRANFSKTALERFGSGWAWLCKAADGRLFITSTPNQDNPLMPLSGLVQGKPILGLDVWEHAYYLKYQNKRSDYIENFWQVVNWAEVERRIKE